jgi:hypothetical protein
LQTSPLPLGYRALIFKLASDEKKVHIASVPALTVIITAIRLRHNLSATPVQNELQQEDLSGWIPLPEVQYLPDWTVLSSTLRLKTPDCE